MDIHKSALLEELMDRICRKRPYPEHRLKSVCAGTQVRYCTKVFKRMLLFLERVVGGGCTFKDDLFRVYLKGLLRFGSRNKGAVYDNGGADIHFSYF